MLRTRIIASTASAVIVSAVFGSVMTFVNRAETFVEPFRVDPSAPAPVTLRIPWTRVIAADGSAAIDAGAPVVAMGEVVSDPELATLVRVFEEGRRPPDGADLLGLFFVYFLIALMLTTYLRGLSPGRGALLRTQLGLVGLTVVLLTAAKIFLLVTPYPAHVVPVAAMSIWAALFLDRQTALIVGLAMAFLAASLVSFRLACMAVYLATSISAVLVLGEKKRPGRILYAGALSAVAAVGVYVAARVIFDGGFDLFVELADPWRSPMVASATSGLLSGAVAWAFSGLAVIVLGSVSRSRLVELSDLDQPLLKKIAEEAPGSWEHSRAMANLAEAAANAIGADALLTRVGAYYHDLGKSCQAKYFVENLQPGEPTPHRHIPPDLSADAIMAHVVEGVNILRRGGSRSRSWSSPTRTTAPASSSTSGTRPSGREPARARRELLPLPGHAPADEGDRDPHAGRLDRGGLADHRPPRAREVRGDGAAHHLREAAAGPARRVRPDAAGAADDLEQDRRVALQHLPQPHQVSLAGEEGRGPACAPPCRAPRPRRTWRAPAPRPRRRPRPRTTIDVEPGSSAPEGSPNPPEAP
ncbi:MAG: HDIG domain-containing protein [Sandaracinaceae bacterium]|nr:HDIG domain-containing protein [Sandaracinaceae bacterium]